MAKNYPEEDLDLGIEQETGSSKKKLIIIIAAALFVLIGGGLGIGWFLLSGSDSDVADEQVEAEAGKKQQPAIYYPMEPMFVVNLPEGGKAKLLQAGVQVMAREQATIDFVKHNDPMIRHNLLNLFASHSDAELSSRDGKKKLQQKVIKQLNEIIENLK